jgi:hypothetical protein
VSQPLSELLAQREGEIPFAPYDAQHAGRLVGERTPRQGSVVVLATLVNTAVVEADRSRYLARLEDLEVESGELSWGPRQRVATWPGSQGARGRAAAQQDRRGPAAGRHCPQPGKAG